MSGLLDKAEHDFISQVIIDLQNATTAKEIESYANHFVLMMRENSRLKAENEQLKQITTGIPLDRLKEICDAMKLMRKEVYAVLGFEGEVKCGEVISIMIYDKNLRVGTWHKSGHYGNVGIDNVFFGENAKERAEARLKELNKDGEI